MISTKDKYNAINMLKEQYPITLLCDIAKVSRSGYYFWCAQKSKSTDSYYEEKILEVYKNSKYTFGYRRVKTQLKKTFGLMVNEKKVLRLMRKLGIQSVVRKKKFKYTNPISNQYAKAEPNILNRNFKAEAINQKWVTDITYLHYGTPRKKAYLSALMDLNNNEIISYKLSTSLEMQFVEDTINHAINKLPKKTLENLIIHSDQGCHYMSRAYKTILRKNNITQSMSRKGNCYDNACIESFFAQLKTELIYQNRYSSKEELFESIHEYIHWYNNERFQRKLKNHTPVEYRSVA